MKCERIYGEIEWNTRETDRGKDGERKGEDVREGGKEREREREKGERRCVCVRERERVGATGDRKRENRNYV